MAKGRMANIMEHCSEPKGLEKNGYCCIFTLGYG